METSFCHVVKKSMMPKREGFDSKNPEDVLLQNFDSKKKIDHVFYSKNIFDLVGDMKKAGDVLAGTTMYILNKEMYILNKEMCKLNKVKLV